jgi:hypothetical protein
MAAIYLYHGDVRLQPRHDMNSPETDNKTFFVSIVFC